MDDNAATRLIDPDVKMLTDIARGAAADLWCTNDHRIAGDWEAMGTTIAEEVAKSGRVMVDREWLERMRGAAEAARNEWGAESRVGLIEGDLERYVSTRD